MVGIRIDSASFGRDIDRVAGSVDKALIKALNWTAFDARSDLQDEMRSVFDNPTPWTINSVYVKKAKPRHQVATVGIKDSTLSGTSAAEYLRSQVEGGDRSVKRVESLLRRSGVIRSNHRLVIASSARKNRHGNITKGRLKKIVNDVRGGRRQGAKYFVMRKGGDPVGIFQRRSRTTLVAEFGITSGAMDYNKLLDMYGVVMGTRNRKFRRAYRRALRQELSR